MPNQLTACTTVEVELDKCALVYGEGSCNARGRGAMDFVEQASWLQGSANTSATAYFSASNERLIVNNISATGDDRIGGIPNFLRAGWTEMARWRVGSSAIGGFGTITSGGELVLNKTPLQGTAPPRVDTAGDWRVRVIGSLSSNATSPMGALDFRIEDNSTVTYRIGETTNLTSTWSGGVASGQGFIIIERNLDASALAGVWRLRRSHIGWSEVGRWEFGLNSESGKGLINASGEVFLNNTPASGSRLPTATDRSVKWRVRIAGNNQTQDAATIGDDLIFERGNEDDAVYLFGSAQRIQATFPNAIGGGGGHLIVERLLDEKVAEGPITLQQDGAKTRILIGTVSVAGHADRGANYAEVNRWNADGATATAGNALYVGATGRLRVNVLDINSRAVTTITGTSNYFRLTRVNPPSSNLPNVLEGTLARANQTTTAIELVVGSAEQMQAAFGSSDITRDGIWTLEVGDLQSATPGVTSPMAVFAGGNASPETNNTPTYTYALDKMVPVEATGDTPCYNTYASCQSLPDYTKDSPGRVYRFCSEGVILDGFAPIIKGQPQHQPVGIKKDFGIFQREKVSVVMADYAGKDTPLDDDYLAVRGTIEGGRPVVSPPTIRYDDVASWRQGDAKTTVGHAYIGIDDTNDASDDTVLYANDIAGTGTTPTNLTGSWRLTRTGGGLPDAVLIGALTQVRDDGLYARYRVGNNADMSYVFASGVPSGETLSYPTVTASWNQGDSAQIHNAYFDADLGALSASTTELTGDITGQPVTPYNEVARWNWGARATSGNAEYLGDSALAEANSICANDTPALGESPVFNMSPNSDDTRWRALTIGTWNGLAAYADGDYVFRNSALYRAVNVIAAPFSTPNGNPVNDGERWNAITTTAWSGVAGYNAGDYVIRNAQLFRAINTILSQATPTNQPPSAGNSVWDSITTTTWDSAAAYNQNDYVVRSGGVYRARNNISAFALNSSPAVDTARWNAIMSVTWDGFAAYNQNDYVVRAGGLYRALNNISVPQPTPNQNPSLDSGRWSAINAQLWSASSNYSSGSYVTRNAVLYQALNGVNANPLNANPANDTTRWGSLTANAWNVNSPYSANDYATHNGVLYRAINAISGAPVIPNTNPATDTTSWNSLTTPAWSSSAGYSFGSYVLYNGSVYRAAANISAPGTITTTFNGAGAPLNAGDMYYSYSTIPLGATPRSFSSRMPPVSGESWANDAEAIAALNGRFVTVTHTSGKTITGSFNSIDTSPSTRLIWRVGTADRMEEAFGTAPITNGTFTVSYTTTANPAPNVDSDWVLVSTPAWSGISAYSTNDVVSYDNSYYRALNNVSAPTPPADPTTDMRWNVVTPTVWSATLAYAPDAYVTHNNILYRAINDTGPQFANKPSDEVDNVLTTTQANRGIWTNGTTMWTVHVTSDGISTTSAIEAYTISTGARDSAKDITITGGSGTYNGLWSDGTTMWLASDALGFSSSKLLAFNLSTGARDSAKDFNTLGAAGNRHPSGIWSDGTTMWVADHDDNKIYAYNLSTKARDASKDFNTIAGSNPLGIWSDGTTMWVADSVGLNRLMYAYNLSTKARDSAKDITPVTANSSPFYLTGDANTMWNSNFTTSDQARNIFAYSLIAGSTTAPNLDTTNWQAVTPPVWSNAAAYATNAVVTYQSILYRANTQITPNTAPNLDTTNWTAVSTTAWSGSVRYEVNALVSYNSNFYRATAVIDAPTPTPPPESDSDNWQAQTTSNWSSTATYSPNNIVVYNAAFYRATQSISTVTNPNNAPENDATNWQAITTSSWANDAAFANNAIVLFQSNYYQAAATIPAPTLNAQPENDATNWELNTVSNWSGQAAYAVNDFVLYNGGHWRANSVIAIPQQAMNTAPESDGANWSLIPTTAWSATTAYAVNDFVSFGNPAGYYFATAQIAAPNTPNATPETDPGNWIAVSASAWNVNSSYSHLNVVTFGSPTVYYEARLFIPVSPSGVFRLRTTETTPKTVTGALTLTKDEAGSFCFRVGSESDMEAAFGTANIPTSATALIILERQASVGVFGNFRLRRSGGDLPDAEVVGVISVSPQQISTGHTAQATWSQGDNATNGRAFITGNGDFAYSTTPATGSATIDSTRTYRLRRSGGEGAGEATASGALTVVSVGEYGARIEGNEFNTLPTDSGIPGTPEFVYTGSFADDTNLLTAVTYTERIGGLLTTTPYIFAFNRDTKARDVAAGFTPQQLAANNGINNRIYGLWGNGTTLYVCGERAATNVICAYNQTTKERIPALDITTLESDGITQPGGIFGFGNLLYVCSSKSGTASEIRAYHLPTLVRSIPNDFNVGFNGLRIAQDIYGDGDTFYITSAIDKKVYAYNQQTKARDSAKDINTLDAAGNDSPTGIYGLGGYVAVSDRVDNKVYAYSIEGKPEANGARKEASDINTLIAAGNNTPTGIHTDGVTMWVCDNNDNKIYGYNVSDGSRKASEDFDTLSAAGNHTPTSCYKHGNIMYVADSEDDKIYAYNATTKARSAADDFNTLSAAGNRAPLGIAVDGARNRMYVADHEDDRIYAYNLTTKAYIAAESFALDTNNTQAAGMTIVAGYSTPTMFVTNFVFGSPHAKVFAYNYVARTRDEAKDIDTLELAGNTIPYGVTVAGSAPNGTIYIADSTDDKIYAYAFGQSVSSPGYRLRIGSSQNMIDAFGAGAPGFPNPQPQNAALVWEVKPVAMWARTNAYSENDVVSYEGRTYRARNAITALPPFQSTYTEVARWNVGQPTSSSTGRAAYDASLGGAFIVNNTANTGALPATSEFHSARRWQVQVVGNAIAARNLTASGLDLRRTNSQTLAAAGRTHLYAVSSPEFDDFWSPSSNAVFDLVGSFNTGGGSVVLSQGSVDNAVPNINTADWEEITPPNWSDTAAYTTGAFVSHNNTFYRALQNVAAPTGSPNATTPAYTWHLEYETFANATDRHLIRVNTADLMRFELTANNPSPPNVNAPAFKWELFRETVSTLTETSNPPDFTFTLAKVVAVPETTTYEPVNAGDPGVITPESTVQKRWLSRNRFFNRRRAKYSVGYVTEDEGGRRVFVPSYTANLTIDQVGINKGGETITLTMKDGINITAKEGAVVPKPTNITLLAPVEADASSFDVEGPDAGQIKVGDDINIGREVLRVLSVNGNTIGVDRAREGTEAQAGRRGDTVQICYSVRNRNAGDVIKDLIDNFSDTNGVEFAQTEFEQVRDIYFASFPISGVITKPIGVSVVIEEIQRSVLAQIWYDSESRVIKIRGITGLNFGFSPNAVPLGDDDILGDTVEIIERPRQSVTRVLGFSGLREATDFGRQSDDWRNVTAEVDSATENANARGESRQYELFSRWINTTQAGVVADRLLQEGSVNSSDIVFEVPIVDGNIPVTVGEVYTYNGKYSQNFYGGASDYPFRVLQISTIDFRRAKVLATRSSVSLRDVNAFIIGVSAYDGEDVLL